MKACILVPAAVAALLLFAAPVINAADTAASAKAKPVLEKGMEAAAIVRIAGQPDEVHPMKAEGVKAEKWIYRRKVDQTVFQTSNTQAFIPALVGFDGDGMVVGKAVVPEYRLKYAELHQVTALLIVDGKLHLGRQWFEQSEQFAN